MAWIESHQELRDHPKTKRLARLLGCSLPQAIGHLHLLWWWALDYAQDGDLTGYDAADIAEVCQWQGDPDEFVDALLRCGIDGRPGFLEQTDGRLVIHDWWQYAGRLVERRRQDAERKRASRRRPSPDDADVHKTSDGRPADVARNSTQPNHTVPNPTQPNQAGPNLDRRVGGGPGEPAQRPPAVPAAHAPSGGSEADPHAQTEDEAPPPDASETERAVLQVLRSIPRYPFDYVEDLAFVRRLAVDYPSVDLLAEAKRWRDWLSGKPPGKNWNPRLRFRNWCDIAAKRPRDRPGPASHRRRYPVDELIEEVMRDGPPVT